MLTLALGSDETRTNRLLPLGRGFTIPAMGLGAAVMPKLMRKVAVVILTWLSLFAAAGQLASYAQGHPGNAPRMGDPTQWNGKSPLALQQGYTLFQYLGVDIEGLFGAKPDLYNFSPTQIVVRPDFQIVYVTYCPKRVGGPCSYTLSDTSKPRLFNAVIFAIGSMQKVNIVEFYVGNKPGPALFGFCFRPADSNADETCIDVDEPTLREMWPDLADPVRALDFITYSRLFVAARNDRLANAQKPTRLEVARNLGIKEKACLKLETYKGRPSETYSGPTEYLNGRYAGQQTYRLPGSADSTVVANTCGIEFYAKISCMGGADVFFGPQERKLNSVNGVCVASKSDRAAN